MSTKELEKLLADVTKALQSAKARDQRNARKAAEKAAAEFGFSLSELSEGGKPTPKKPKTKSKSVKKPSKAKYANPADKTQTWSGKGRPPNWYSAEVKKGTSPEAMLV
ncbi:H-NS family nucleoid-associated regulatory protein [Roseovarius sp. S1116L3]|uniref:H-NS histone family protein n=1 Tax=Roseovarius roseus TaxID=3342636 RepID=UPI00372A5EF6